MGAAVVTATAAVFGAANRTRETSSASRGDVDQAFATSRASARERAIAAVLDEHGLREFAQALDHSRADGDVRADLERAVRERQADASSRVCAEFDWVDELAKLRAELGRVSPN